MDLDELSKSVFEVSVNWDNLYELKYFAGEDLQAKEKYNSCLKNLVSFGVLSFDSKNNWKVLSKHPLNPKLDDKVLYFVSSKDAEKVRKKFYGSFVVQTD